MITLKQEEQVIVVIKNGEKHQRMTVLLYGGGFVRNVNFIGYWKLSIHRRVINSDMKYSIVFFFLLSILGVSCVSHKEQIVDLPNPTSLLADSITTPPVLLSVTRLFIVHDMLVAYEQRKDTLFSFWKLPECQYLFNAGVKGQGPNDFLILDRNFVESKEGFKVFELPSNRVKELKIDSSGTFKLISEQRLKVNQMPLNRFLFLADSSYCFLSQDDKYEYTLLDKKQDTHQFSDYPFDLLKKDKGDDNNFVYNKLTVSKPDGEMFASFYVYIKMMRIYNRHGEMLNEIVLEHANSSLDNEEKITYYPYPPCADNKYIYVLTKQEEEPILEVWTWNGELVERYSLDKKISNFVVSNKYHTLYAVNKDIEDKIYVYKLPL